VPVAAEITIPAANRGPDYPGNAAVSAAVIAWAADFFTVGLDVYRSEVSGVAVQIAGVENVSLVRLADSPAPPGVYAAADYAITDRQIAVIDQVDVLP
jgi:hypothetical protein